MSKWIDQQSPEMFMDWFHRVDVPMLIKGIDGDIYWTNQAFEEFIGYTNWELTGKNMSWKKISVNDDNIEAEINMMQECIDGHQTKCSMKKQYIPKNDKPVWVDLNLCRFPPYGDIKCFLAVVQPLKNGVSASFSAAMDTIKDFTEKMEQQNKGLNLMESNIIEGVSKKLESTSEIEQIFLSTARLVQKYPKISATIIMVILVMILGTQIIQAFKTVKEMLPG